MASQQNRYEGCGAEGPVRCIFLSEFHPEAGPKIRCQVPKDLLPKDVFDAVSVYIIPKQQLVRHTLTVNVLGYKICGHPIIMENKKYKRNQFMFNLCMVCHPWSRTVQYEPALKKLADYMVNLELESEFVSREENTPALVKMLQEVFEDINRASVSTIKKGNDTLKLKVTHYAPDPPVVHDHDVPMLLINHEEFGDKWDLTTQQLLPFMNGVNHVTRIADDAEVEMNLVKAAIQNLVYHRVVNLIPIFMYNNVYCVTPKLSLLREDMEFQKQFLRRVAQPKEAKPVFKDVYEFVCGLTPGNSVRDLCLRLSPRELCIDEVLVIQFLVLNGILRRIRKYPVYVGTADSKTQLHEWFTGVHHYDEICCKTGMSHRQLDEKIETDSNVIILRK